MPADVSAMAQQILFSSYCELVKPLGLIVPIVILVVFVLAQADPETDSKRNCQYDKHGQQPKQYLLCFTHARVL